MDPPEKKPKKTLKKELYNTLNKKIIITSSPNV